MGLRRYILNRSWGSIREGRILDKLTRHVAFRLSVSPPFVLLARIFEMTRRGSTARLQWAPRQETFRFLAIDVCERKR